MKKGLRHLACLAAFCLAASAQAEVLTFDSLALIDIDNQTSVAIYTEGNFRITGVATSYLPLDFFGAGGTGGLLVFSNSPIQLMAADGGLFSLLRLDYAAADPFEFGFDPSASVSVSGLVNGGGLLQQTLLLDDLGFNSFSFPAWNNLTEVNIAATADFFLDNVIAAKQAIPEPASLALVSIALSGLALIRRRKRATGQ